MKIAIVDSNLLSNSVRREALKSAGHVVRILPELAAAKAFVGMKAATKIEAVICVETDSVQDDGIDWAKSLKIPVILLTANDRKVEGFQTLERHDVSPKAIGDLLNIVGTIAAELARKAA